MSIFWGKSGHWRVGSKESRQENSVRFGLAAWFPDNNVATFSESGATGPEAVPNGLAK